MQQLGIPAQEENMQTLTSLYKNQLHMSQAFQVISLVEKKPRGKNPRDLEVSNKFQELKPETIHERKKNLEWEKIMSLLF